MVFVLGDASRWNGRLPHAAPHGHTLASHVVNDARLKHSEPHPTRGAAGGCGCGFDARTSASAETEPPAAADASALALASFLLAAAARSGGDDDDSAEDDAPNDRAEPFNPFRVVNDGLQRLRNRE